MRIAIECSVLGEQSSCGFASSRKRGKREVWEGRLEQERNKRKAVEGSEAQIADKRRGLEGELEGERQELFMMEDEREKLRLERLELETELNEERNTIGEVRTIGDIITGGPHALLRLHLDEYDCLRKKYLSTAREAYIRGDALRAILTNRSDLVATGDFSSSREAFPPFSNSISVRRRVRTAKRPKVATFAATCIASVIPR